VIAAVPVRKCAVCPKLFERRSTMHTVCSYPCTVKLAKLKEREAKKAAADDRRRTRAQLEALKPRSKWLSEAQAAFNYFIRMRDAHLPCISCGKPAHGAGSWDAGHYLTVGARPELRFNEDNVHRQCVKCNQHLHGNLVLYRLGLIERRGQEVVALLEGPHPPAKYTVDELRQIRDTYRRKARDIKKQQEQEITA
jgi:hypothetical protein